ncbi:MAG: LEPR-XLL domain-containing protein, partial [Gammaproteobacteria bacterium]|nr:LEPR-XLL domain-containing protein [Gammaproteobacteria bacterium]NIP87548.1 LEPR-XLL domain-containing protein [Gammaproteobacteria bacterium]NIR21893.1 LEPR-XLL domain-containing protein [Gammaproteobacteria bacterium]NIS03593.1 LEPR-XLL domain-containing protein [Gammaproteobacteria bacterium]NIU40341.1 LEPR-XLL domain-containing protein [Gammaproteobacteria bacterium]
MKKVAPSKTPIRRALMEELEPRLLFSADLPGV